MFDAAKLKKFRAQIKRYKSSWTAWGPMWSSGKPEKSGL